MRNSGRRAGDEVAQLYVRNVEARADRPKKRLVAFERIHLTSGETKTVSRTVAFDQLAFWDDRKKGWGVDPGALEVMVGGSSVDIRLREQFRVGGL